MWLEGGKVKFSDEILRRAEFAERERSSWTLLESIWQADQNARYLGCPFTCGR